VNVKIKTGRVRFEENCPIINAEFATELLVLSEGSPKARELIDSSKDINPSAKIKMQQTPVILPDTREEVYERVYAMVGEVGDAVFVELVLKGAYHPLKKEPLRQALLRYYEAFTDTADGVEDADKYEGLSQLFYNAGLLACRVMSSVLPDDAELPIPSLEKTHDAFMNNSTAMMLLDAAVRREREAREKE
jgi:hypothetical protein